VEIRSTAGLFALVLTMNCSSLAAQEEQTPDVQPQYTAEIAVIRSNRSVQAAMEHIVAIEPQSRRDLIELTEIPAPPIVQRAVAATQAFGIEPQLLVSSTDANLPISKGIPAVTMSRGGVSGDSHAPEEWWQNKDGHIGIQIGLITLLAEAGIAD